MKSNVWKWMRRDFATSSSSHALPWHSPTWWRKWVRNFFTENFCSLFLTENVWDVWENLFLVDEMVHPPLCHLASKASSCSSWTNHDRKSYRSDSDQIKGFQIKPADFKPKQGTSNQIRGFQIKSGDFTCGSSCRSPTQAAHQATHQSKIWICAPETEKNQNLVSTFMWKSDLPSCSTSTFIWRSDLPSCSTSCMFLVAFHSVDCRHNVAGNRQPRKRHKRIMATGNLEKGWKEDGKDSEWEVFKRGTLQRGLLPSRPVQTSWPPSLSSSASSSQVLQSQQLPPPPPHSPPHIVCLHLPFSQTWFKILLVTLPPTWTKPFGTRKTTSRVWQHSVLLFDAQCFMQFTLLFISEDKLPRLCRLV